MPVASMPMYDMPEVSGALDSYWRGLVGHLGRQGITDVPATIVHGRDLSDLWNDPELWLSQCCGYDLVNRYAGKLQPIATPHYAAPECKGRNYSSVIIVAEDAKAMDVLQMRGSVCAINGPESHSGMSSLRALVAPASHEGRFFSAVKISGTHADSLAMIKSGDADVAAIDCVTYALMQQHRPTALTGTRKLGRTYRAPAIPYVTRYVQDPDTVDRTRTAIFETFADTDLATTREALFLKDVEVTSASDYKAISDSQRFAASHGYPTLQ